MHRRLRELGWVDGKTCRYVDAYGEGSEAHLDELASTLVREQVDVIYALGPEAAIAAARKSRTIPIVFWGVPYPVEQGLVESFPRPHGNATGVAWNDPGVDAKRVEILREIAPSARRLASIIVPAAVRTVSGRRIEVTTDVLAARALGFEVREFPVSSSGDFAQAFDAILAWEAQALTAWGHSLTYRERRRIVDFANRSRLPSSFTVRQFAEAGGLVSYAIVMAPTFVRIAEYVDQVLRGAQPGELPVSIPREYELAINVKTARALGLRVPKPLLLRADRVIE